MDSVKDGSFSNKTTDNSNAKSSPKMKHTSKRHHKGSITDYLMIPRHFRSTTKVTSSVYKTPTSSTSQTTKANCQAAGKHQSTMNQGQCHARPWRIWRKLYPNSFDRLGSLKGAYNIRVDPTVKPVTHARRKVPIESKEAIDKELDYLIEEEIITEQVEPTPWVSSVMFPRKPNGEVRVCLDSSNLNKAIIREHHKPMTVEEIAHELAGATVHTKADALKAFLQIHLMHKASLLTTFNSHQGWLRFLRMPFGAKMSQDMFQASDGCHSRAVPRSHRNSRWHGDLWGGPRRPWCQPHQPLKRMPKGRIGTKQQEVGNFEERESHSTGQSTAHKACIQTPRRSKGSQKWQRPQRSNNFQSFLGMVNYMGTFIPNLSHHTEPLLAMLKKDNMFHWDNQQTRSFQQVKTLIAKANTTPLRYYDRNLPVTVQADASLRGLGACLIQKHEGKDQPIAFASKSLTDAETRHNNIEREILGHHLCLPTFQHLSTRKELCSREWPQTTWDDCHEEPCECATTSSENAAGVTEIRCHHQVSTREGNATGHALSHCPARASQEIKLDMRVDYIAFTKPWIEKLKDSMQRDPILATVYQLTQQGWLPKRRQRTTFSEKILGLQRQTINRWWNAPERTEVNHTRETSRGVSKPSTRRPSLSK